VAYRDDLLCAFVGSTASFPDDLLDVPSAESARSSVADLMRGWHPALRRAILQSDPSSVKAFELMAAAPVDPWPSDSVVLLGDAIHSMPPSAGWGTILLSATPISSAACWAPGDGTH
jgi:2-polyprenyl-6-methoxyphenol hydroxylase-like FAD-dependent oxidoreductase